MLRCAALLAVVSVAFTPVLYAQESDEGWLATCRRDRWSESRVRRCEIRETGFKGTRALTVDPAMNGGVEVVGWDRDSIAVTARIQVSALSDDDADAIARGVKIEAAGSTIRASGPGLLGRRQHWSVSFVVSVPHKIDLSIATDNGPLSVSDVSGHMELSTSNGPLALNRVGGDVHARAQNGPLQVDLEGTRWDGAGLDASTMNGPADLRIPDGYNAKIEFGTVNGPMHIGFPLTVTLSGRVTDRISTTLGAGGPPVRVVTTNGPMTVRRW